MKRRFQPSPTMVTTSISCWRALAVQTAILEGLHQQGDAFEVLVVEIGSTDNTRTGARSLAARLTEVEATLSGPEDYGAAVAFWATRGGRRMGHHLRHRFCGPGVSMPCQSRQVAESTGAIIMVGSKCSPGALGRCRMGRKVVNGAYTSLLGVDFRLPMSDSHGLQLRICLAHFRAR